MREESRGSDPQYFKKLVVCQIYFDGFLVVRASCPRERDAHTTVHYFYLDRLLASDLIYLDGLKYGYHHNHQCEYH